MLGSSSHLHSMGTGLCQELGGVYALAGGLPALTSCAAVGVPAVAAVVFDVYLNVCAATTLNKRIDLAFSITLQKITKLQYRSPLPRTLFNPHPDG
jgi:hypothetical protein